VIANTKAADLTQGEEFWHEGQLYRVSLNIKKDNDERKLYAYRTEGKPGMEVIWLPGTRVVPVQQEDAPPE
jgi:hypothetical protein